MIYLFASSSNTATFLPTGSYADGSGFVIKFTDRFTQDSFFAQGTGSKNDKWFSLEVDVTGSYVLSTNKSSVPLKGGGYDVNIYPITDMSPIWDVEDTNWELETYEWDETVVAISVYGTEPRRWAQMGSLWSSVAGLPSTTGNGILTTTAFVSESISRTMYTSANESAAYVVYNG